MSWGLGARKRFSTDNSDLAVLVAEENGETCSGQSCSMSEK